MAEAVSPPTSPVPTQKRSRLPGYINVGLGAACAVVVAIFALRAASSQPPAIAEFAPQAQQQIKQAPSEQTALAGFGEGGNSISALPSPLASLAPLLGSPSPSPDIILGKVRHCIGNPPRQIEDPQSPPCVPYYDGPTPGATYKGVGSSGEILIEYTQNGIGPSMLAYQNFLNQNFEFYGRHIKLYDATTDPSPADPATQRSNADAADSQHHVFGALDYNSGGGIEYSDELAHRGLVSVLSRPYLPESYLSNRRPYVWSYPMATDGMERTLGSWACSRLKGQAATHAGIGLQGKPRVYGLFFSTESVDIPVTSQALQDAVAACGISFAYVAPPQNGNSQTGSSSTRQNDAAVITEMQTHGVTTIFCLCEELTGMGQFATSQAYYPEWIISSYILNDYYQRERCCGLPSEQAQHAFGLSFIPMIRVFSDHPATWADAGNPYQSDTVQVGRDYEYQVLLLMASGIQMAGPNLTPATFEAGLQRARFPNPDHPIMAGKVGFLGGSHSMTIDAAEIYWSSTATGPYPDATAGTFCYVDHGARHSIGNFPVGGDPFFNPACDSGGQPAR